jgi:hypothetical protein
MTAQLRHKGHMKAVHPSLEKPNITLEKPLRCSQRGWPGTGKMQASALQRNGKDVLIGRLSYFRISSVLCSICQEMESAVASRQWFVEAHDEDAGS